MFNYIMFNYITCYNRGPERESVIVWNPSMANMSSMEIHEMVAMSCTVAMYDMAAMADGKK